MSPVLLISNTNRWLRRSSEKNHAERAAWHTHTQKGKWMNPRTTERDSSVRVGAACGLIQPLRAKHREVQKPVTHIDPHDNSELQIAKEECDSALHAYVYKPCGTRLVCITRSEEECENHEFSGRYK